MKTYQITYEWPNGDWTWIDVEVKSFHEAVELAFKNCDKMARIASITILNLRVTKQEIENGIRRLK